MNLISRLVFKALKLSSPIALVIVGVALVYSCNSNEEKNDLKVGDVLKESDLNEISRVAEMKNGWLCFYNQWVPSGNLKLVFVDSNLVIRKISCPPHAHIDDVRGDTIFAWSSSRFRHFSSAVNCYSTEFPTGTVLVQSEIRERNNNIGFATEKEKVLKSVEFLTPKRIVLKSLKSENGRSLGGRRHYVLYQAENDLIFTQPVVDTVSLVDTEINDNECLSVYRGMEIEEYLTLSDSVLKNYHEQLWKIMTAAKAK